MQRDAGGDLRLSSDKFLPKLHLDEGSALTWVDGRFTGVVVRIAISHLLPQDLYPRLKTRDFWADLTGELKTRLTVRLNGFSAKARAAIEAAGGSCETV